MNDRPHVTVLVPTHNHSHLIGYALRSIQRQTFKDLELFVVGDGAPAATRDVVASLASTDSRIRYFDFPKGERHGELNRHVALAEARGSLVAYCGDDDLWLPDHLSSLVRLLRRADFANMIQVEIYLKGALNVRLGNLAHATTRKRMLDEGFGFFGLTEAGHSLAAYRRLDEGWAPAPVGTPSDQHLFRKFVALPGIRCASANKATAIHLPSPLRLKWPDEARVEELRGFSERLDSPSLRHQLRDAIVAKRRAEWPLRQRLQVRADNVWRGFATMLSASRK